MAAEDVALEQATFEITQTHQSPRSTPLHGSSAPTRSCWAALTDQRYLGVPEKTLAQWRSDRHGPLPLRIGRYVRYRVPDVEDWIDQQAAQARRWMAS